MRKLLLLIAFSTTLLLTGCAQTSTQRYKSKSLIIADSLDRAVRYDSVEFNLSLTRSGDSITQFTASFLGGKSSFRLKIQYKFGERTATRNQISSFYYCLEQTVKRKFVLSIVQDAKTKRINSFGVWDGKDTFIFIIKDPVEPLPEQQL